MKRAIVTGGAGLIGNALCTRLIAEGWQVASFDLKEGLSGARQIHCDLGDEASVEAAFEALGWESLDLLVNNGGQTDGLGRTLDGLSLTEWNQMIGSHLTGAFLMSRSAARLMGAGGAIVNMASTRAIQSEGHDFAYAAAKGGIVGLTQALAVQLGPKIRVNAIAPGWITDETALSDEDHAQHPVGRVGATKDIADAVVYLAGAGFVTGQLLPVDGGMTKKMIYVE